LRVGGYTVALRGGGKREGGGGEGEEWIRFRGLRRRRW